MSRPRYVIFPVLDELRIVRLGPSDENNHWLCPRLGWVESYSAHLGLVVGAPRSTSLYVRLRTGQNV